MRRVEVPFVVQVKFSTFAHDKFRDTRGLGSSFINATYRDVGRPRGSLSALTTSIEQVSPPAWGTSVRGSNRTGVVLTAEKRRMWLKRRRALEAGEEIERERETYKKNEKETESEKERETQMAETTERKNGEAAFRDSANPQPMSLVPSLSLSPFFPSKGTTEIESRRACMSLDTNERPLESS